MSYRYYGVHGWKVRSDCCLADVCYFISRDVHQWWCNTAVVYVHRLYNTIPTDPRRMRKISENMFAQ